MTDTGRIPSIPGIPSVVLVAPDSFKGTVPAAAVAHAIGAGLQSAGLEVDLCPVADGGEGTLEALIEALGGSIETISVGDPLGRPVEAAFGLVAGGRRRGTIGVVETAAASGLHLVADSDRDPVAAST